MRTSRWPWFPMARQEWIELLVCQPWQPPEHISQIVLRVDAATPAVREGYRGQIS